MRKFRPVVIAIFICGAIALLTSQASAITNLAPSSPPGSNPPFQAGFPVALSGNGHVRNSSVALGDLTGDSLPDIVVGDSVGRLHAYDGFGEKLWSYNTGNMAIEGKAAIGDINHDGWNEVVIGAGSTITLANHGGLYVLNHNGQLICSSVTGDFDHNGWRDGVYSSPALADLDENDGGKLEIVFGGWDGYVRVLNDDCSLVWQKFVRDTVWSSPAIGDMDRDGHLDIVIGVDSHAEPDLQPPIFKGGRLEVWDRFGAPLPGFPKHVDEVIFSSPALGDINNDGWLEIAVGTGNFWGDPNCGHPDGCTPGVGHYVNIWDHNGNPLPDWPRPTNDYVWASPALADLDDDGSLEIIVNSNDALVHAWNSDGSEVPGWPVKPITPASCGSTVSFATIGSPVVVDLDGNGSMDVLLASNWEIAVWNRDGVQQTRTKGCPDDALNLATNYSLNSTPAVGDIDGDGDIEIIIGGAMNSSGSPGAIYAWSFGGRSTAESMPWPTFRRDAQNFARHPIAPILSVTPSSLFFLHETNTTPHPAESLRIENLGDGSFTWSATPADSRVSISPADGNLVTVDTPIEVAVNTNGLGVGQHTYYVTLTALQDGEPISGSPFTVSIVVSMADEVYRAFVPSVLGN